MSMLNRGIFKGKKSFLKLKNHVQKSIGLAQSVPLTLIFKALCVCERVRAEINSRGPVCGRTSQSSGRGLHFLCFYFVRALLQKFHFNFNIFRQEICSRFSSRQMFFNDRLPVFISIFKMEKGVSWGFLAIFALLILIFPTIFTKK